MRETKIQWCDHSASPWHGCSKVHAGCDHCYAERQSWRNPSTLGVWGEDGVRVKSQSFIGNLRRWQKQAAKAGTTVSVFPSICDPFEDRPELAPWREEMFAVIDECPNVRLLLLTKRPENVRRMWPPKSKPIPAKWPPTVPDMSAWECRRENVWLGTSISTRPRPYVPELLECRDLTPVLFVSCEPLLETITLEEWFPSADGTRTVDGEGDDMPNVDWVIVGGESGPKARPCDVEWVRSLRDQCTAAGVPCFVKQLGSNSVRTVYGGPGFVGGQPTHRLSHVFKNKLRDPKGGDPSEWPEDLRVRQFPHELVKSGASSS